MAHQGDARANPRVITLFRFASRGSLPPPPPPPPRAHEGDATANIRVITLFGFSRGSPPLPPPQRTLIPEQPASTSSTAPSILPVVKKRKKLDIDLLDFTRRLEDRVRAPPQVRVNKTTAVANVTVEDADALDCGVCFLALRPPIFQCEVGHVVCSACRDKLEATGNGKCHVCRAATRGGGYRRCHAMERLVDCIRVPCPYAVHGCDATPPYHGQDSHRQVCPHAPCRCPGGDSCGGFIGSTAALLDHFAGTHNWPSTTGVRAQEAFDICLHDGFNFVFLLANQASQSAANCSVPCRLFLLNMTRERLGRAISVICIHPHTSTSATAAAAANGAYQRPLTQCELVFLRHGDRSTSTTSSVFSVVCTDLSNGLPNHEGCFQFFVPSAVLGLEDHKSSIQVKARIIN